MNVRNVSVFVVLFLGILTGYGQEIRTDDPLKKYTWQAAWIAHPSASLTEYGVFLYRKSFSLPQKPERLRVYLSADNRYRLFVNGVPVGQGPTRSDLAYWHYETLDLGPYLREGTNTVAAQVYNYGEHRSGGQISHKTSFILQSEDAQYAEINTGRSWKVTLNEAWQPLPVSPQTVQHYYRVFGFYTAGPGDRVDASRYPWGWESPTFDDRQWENARVVAEDAVQTGVGRGYAYGSTRFLVPSQLPAMREEAERIPQVLRSSGVQAGPAFLQGKSPLRIPANSRASLLLDRTRMTIGYPELIVSQGRGSQITLTYAEALLDTSFRKGNRNEFTGKALYGYSDVFLPDGGNARTFRPLWLRAFRFVQLDIQTGPEELIVNDYYNQFSTYPLQLRAEFSGDDPALNAIWQAGWRTLHLCAQGNYFSDAYYEQMQYIGDARTQALATYYLTGDEQLFRNALRQFDRSRVPEGLTMSRYPARETQIIPSYSLAWIAMIHDYLMIRNDQPFIRQFMPGIRSVLSWFADRVDTTGMLGELTWWYFPDREANESGTFDSQSALATLQYVDALQKAAEICTALGAAEEAERYAGQANARKEAVLRNCYVNSEGLFAESPRKNMYTQATNAMAILTGMLPEAQQPALMEKILTDKRLVESTLYYKFYVFRAMEKSGYTQSYFDQLYPWHRMIAQGMTTFGEVAENPRSECHPWSASPNIDFFRIVCGVQPLSFGYSTVRIAPVLGKLNQLQASLPHPEGTITLNLKRQKGNKLSGMVTLPAQVKGRFEWNGKVLELRGGEQKISL